MTRTLTETAFDLLMAQERARLDYFFAMQDSLFGAHSLPATQGGTHNERIAPSDNVEPSVQEGEAGASASPNTGEDE